MNWVAIGGGMDQPTIYSLANFLRAIPDGSMLTVESSMRNVLPINMMGMAMGLHVRCGIEDNLWNQSRTAKMTTVKQIEQLVRISREFGREVATGKEAREICKIGVFYDTVEETLAANGFAPNAKGRQQGFLRKAAREARPWRKQSGFTRPADPRSCSSRRSPSATPGPARCGFATSRSASTSPTRTSAPGSIRCRCLPAWGSRRPASSRRSARA